MGYAFSPFGEEAMPWKECSVMDERLQFVARRLAGEPMAELCREFGISRKTGYKIFDRYQECGVQGLTDRSRRPDRYANQLPFQVENYMSISESRISEERSPVGVSAYSLRRSWWKSRRRIDSRAREGRERRTIVPTEPLRIFTS